MFIKQNKLYIDYNNAIIMQNYRELLLLIVYLLLINNMCMFSVENELYR